MEEAERIFLPRSRKPSATLDNEFWDSVDELIFGYLNSYFGIGTDRIKRYCADQSGRIASYVEGASTNTGLRQTYDFFSNSPLCMITYRSYVLPIGLPVALAYDKHSLLIQIQTFLGEEYSLEILRQSVPSALEKVGLGGPVADFMKLPSKKISAFRALSAKVYSQWFDYVKRHSTLPDPDKRGPWKLDALVKTLDSLRSHDIGTIFYSTATLLQSTYLVDKTLCYSLPPESNSPVLGPMTSKAFPEITSKYQFRPMHYSMLKDILQLHQAQLIHGSNRWPPTPEPCFTYEWKGQRHSVFYNKGSDCFSCQRQIRMQPTSLYQAIRLESGKDALVPKEFLWNLSRGNWNNFCTIAKIFACCASNEKVFSGIGYCPANVSMEFVDALFTAADISLPEEVKWYSLSQLLLNTSVDFLISCKLAGARITACKDDSKKLRPEQWKRLKKLLNGSTVSCPDSVLKRKMHQNRTQWIINGDDRTIKRFQAENIPILPMPASCEVPALPSSAIPWLKTILPLWGMLLLKKQRRQKINIVPYTLEAFVNARCMFTHSKDEFLPARQLYDSYLDFCRQHGYQDYLLFKDFNDAMEQNFGQAPVRCHKSKSENKLGFWYVRLLPYEAPSPPPTQPANRDDFYYRLDPVTQEVLQHFPDFPFQELFEK